MLSDFVIPDFANVAAALVAAIAVLLTALFAVRQLRSAQTANHTQVAEDYVVNKLAAQHPGPASASAGCWKGRLGIRCPLGRTAAAARTALPMTTMSMRNDA